MDNIDLIPGDYRRAKWLKRWLRETGILGAVVLTVMVTTVVLLSSRTDSMRERSEALEKQRAVSSGQRARIDSLNGQKSDLSQQLQVLASLRSGAPARSVFVAIDRALEDSGVWFLNWQFRRAGVIVSDPGGAGIPTGYFVVIPPEGDTPNGEMLVETHMSIQGQARDHEALSRFVKGLFSQQPVVDVSVRKTAMRRVGGQDVVDFDLTVVLNSETSG